MKRKSWCHYRYPHHISWSWHLTCILRAANNGRTAHKGIGSESHLISRIARGFPYCSPHYRFRWCSWPRGFFLQWPSHSRNRLQRYPLELPLQGRYPDVAILWRSGPISVRSHYLNHRINWSSVQIRVHRKGRNGCFLGSPYPGLEAGKMWF